MSHLAYLRFQASLAYVTHRSISPSLVFITKCCLMIKCGFRLRFRKQFSLIKFSLRLSTKSEMVHEFKFTQG